MADASNSARSASAPAEMIVNITGKIEESRSAQGKYYTTVKLPGADEYDQPTPLELRSDRPLGEIGAIVTCRASLGGFYRKSYQRDEVDQRTGQIIGKRTIRPVVNALSVLH